MIANLKPYPAMKYSGMTCLGEVPEHWEVSALRRKIRTYDGIKIGPFGSQLKLEQMSPSGYKVYGQANVIAKDFSRGTKFVDQEKFNELSACAVLPNDLLVTMMGTSGRCAYVPHAASEGIMDSHLLRLRTDFSINVRFASRIIDESPYVKEQISVTGKGSIMHGLNSGMVKALVLALPPLPEQAAIVRFLDHTDRRIRRYILAKQKLVKLLEGQKKALIHQAVTGQVDVRTGQAYPAYKPSGVEWLGDVPEHWEVRRVKSLSLVKRGASPRPIADPKYFDDDGEYAWVRIADVTASSRYLERTTQRLSVLGQSLSVPLEPGALFLSIAGSVGKPMITRIKCCIHDGFVYFPQFNGDADFLYRVFASGTPFARLGKLGTQLNLNTDTVGNILLGWPPSEEQAAIVSFLDQATADLDTATTSTQREISLLSEYRTRLIADVVTGKLDVRTASAWLPDEVEEQELLDETDALIDGDEATADDLDTTTEEAAV